MTPVREKVRRWKRKEGKKVSKVSKVPKVQSPSVNRGKVTKQRNKKENVKQKLI